MLEILEPPLKYHAYASDNHDRERERKHHGRIREKIGSACIRANMPSIVDHPNTNNIAQVTPCCSNTVGIVQPCCFAKARPYVKPNEGYVTTFSGDAISPCATRNCHSTRIVRTSRLYDVNRIIRQTRCRGVGYHQPLAFRFSAAFDRPCLVPHSRDHEVTRPFPEAGTYQD